MFRWIPNLIKQGKATRRRTQLEGKLKDLNSLKRTQFEHLETLAAQECVFLTNGKSTLSMIGKRHMAAEILDIRHQSKLAEAKINSYGRMVQVARVYLANIEITDHRFELQGLPSHEELIEQTVNAEEMLIELQEQTNILSTVGIPSIDITEDEQEIMNELQSEPVMRSPNIEPAFLRGTRTKKTEEEKQTSETICQEEKEKEPA